MTIIGLLPAAGSATRISGIPKFCFPVESEITLLEWHVRKMKECCDEIVIATRDQWLPIISNLNLPKCEIVIKEPSTFSDALNFMMKDDLATYLVGMPDTYINNSTSNHYTSLASSSANVTISAFKCSADQIGKVGQILFDDKMSLIDLRDKSDDCAYSHLWGAFAVREVKIDPGLSTPSLQMMDWAKDPNLKVKVQSNIGTYIDFGEFKNVIEYYKSIKEII
jgi:GTP:adenosylcobinamide-phosphate guanylyltransferase